jgi:hypothetical protein
MSLAAKIHLSSHLQKFQKIPSAPGNRTVSVKESQTAFFFLLQNCAKLTTLKSSEVRCQLKAKSQRQEIISY